MLENCDNMHSTFNSDACALDESKFQRVCIILLHFICIIRYTVINVGLSDYIEDSVNLNQVYGSQFRFVIKFMLGNYLSDGPTQLIIVN